MLQKKCIILFCSYLNIYSIFGGSRITKPTSTPTTSKPRIPLLERFHQNDYKLKYEWTEVAQVNKDFMEYTAIAFKFNRTTTAKNFSMFLKIDLAYDMEVIVQVYKFASNEYREFPTRFQVNSCAALSKDIMGVNKFSQYGNLTCPLLKGKRYVVVNWTPSEVNFPPLFPSGKYMMEQLHMFHSTEILVTRDYATIYRPITVFEN